MALGGLRCSLRAPAWRAASRSPRHFSAVAVRVKHAGAVPARRHPSPRASEAQSRQRGLSRAHTEDALSEGVRQLRPHNNWLGSVTMYLAWVGSDQGGLRNAMQGVANKRASKGKLASFATLLGHPIWRTLGFFPSIPKRPQRAATPRISSTTSRDASCTDYRLNTCHAWPAPTGQATLGMDSHEHRCNLNCATRWS